MRKFISLFPFFLCLGFDIAMWTTTWLAYADKVNNKNYNAWGTGAAFVTVGTIIFSAMWASYVLEEHFK